MAYIPKYEDIPKENSKKKYVPSLSDLEDQSDMPEASVNKGGYSMSFHSLNKGKKHTHGMFVGLNKEQKEQEKIKGQKLKEFAQGASQSIANYPIKIGNIGKERFNEFNYAPNTEAAKYGGIAGDVGSFFMPGAAVNSVLKAASIIPKAKNAIQLMKNLPGMKSISNIGRATGEGALFSAANHPQNAKEEALKGGAISGGIQTGINTLLSANPLVRTLSRLGIGFGAGYGVGGDVKSGVMGMAAAPFVPKLLNTIGVTGRNKHIEDSLEGLTLKDVLKSKIASERLNTSITPAEASGNPITGAWEGSIRRTPKSAQMSYRYKEIQKNQQENAISNMLDYLYIPTIKNEKKISDLYSEANKVSLVPGRNKKSPKLKLSPNLSIENVKNYSKLNIENAKNYSKSKIHNIKKATQLKAEQMRKSAELKIEQIKKTSKDNKIARMKSSNFKKTNELKVAHMKKSSTLKVEQVKNSTQLKIDQLKKSAQLKSEHLKKYAENKAASIPKEIKYPVVEKMKENPILRDAFDKVKSNPVFEEIPQNNYKYLAEVERQLGREYEAARFVKSSSAYAIDSVRRNFNEFIKKENILYKIAAENAQPRQIRQSIERRFNSEAEDFTGKNFYKEFLTKKQKYRDLLKEVKDFPAVKQNIIDMRHAWKHLSNIEGVSSGSSKGESALKHARNQLYAFLESIEKAAGERYNRKALQFIYSDDWHKGFDKLDKIKNFKEKRDTMLKLFARVGVAYGLTPEK